MLPQRLTYYRLQPKGVTHADPAGTLLEMSYAMLKNLVPLVDLRGAYPTLPRMLEWIVGHGHFALLSSPQRYRLLGAFMLGLRFQTYSDFLAAICSDTLGDMLLRTGRRCLALILENPLLHDIDKLQHEISAYIEARDFWHAQSDSWEARARAFQAAKSAAV